MMRKNGKRFSWVSLTILLIVGALVVGCQAPEEVKYTAAVRDKALSNYVRNNQQLSNTMEKMFLEVSTTQLDLTTEILTEKILDKYSEDGKLTNDQVRELVTALMQEREESQKAIQSTINRYRIAQAKNAQEFAKAAELNEALNDWMNAGIDEAFIEETSNVILETLTEQMQNSTQPVNIENEVD